MKTGTNGGEQVNEGVDLDVFVNTPRGRAALEAAGQAVVSVALVQRLETVRIEQVEPEGQWQSVLTAECDASRATFLINMMAGPMTAYACGLSPNPLTSTDVDCRHHEGDWVDAILEFWLDTPQFDTEFEPDFDGVPVEEIECLFHLHKSRTLRLLSRPSHVRAILALAQELLTRDEVSAEEADALIEQHLTT